MELDTNQQEPDRMQDIQWKRQIITKVCLETSNKKKTVLTHAQTKENTFSTSPLEDSSRLKRQCDYDSNGQTNSSLQSDPPYCVRETKLILSAFYSRNTHSY